MCASWRSQLALPAGAGLGAGVQECVPAGAPSQAVASHAQLSDWRPACTSSNVAGSSSRTLSSPSTRTQGACLLASRKSHSARSLGSMFRQSCSAGFAT